MSVALVCPRIRIQLGESETGLTPNRSHDLAQPSNPPELAFRARTSPLGAVGGSFQQGIHGALTISLTGTSKGVDPDRLTVAGGAVLNGTLALNFATPPTSGQKYVLIDAAGGISGSITSIVSPGAKVSAGHDAESFYVTVQ